MKSVCLIRRFERLQFSSHRLCRWSLTPGLEDLAAGRKTEASLLVASCASRLRELGIEIQGSMPVSPEHELYHLLSVKYGDDAHSRYNGLIRRLVSFERALERQVRASGGTGAPARGFQ